MTKTNPMRNMDISNCTIGEIVARDYRTATVFERHGLDFCCGGNSGLAAICTEKGLDLAAITEELDAVKSTPGERSQNYSSWDVSFLADYIINTHHVYLKENTAQIAAHVHKIVEVHGARHPELIEIAPLFDKIAIDMATHLREEEGTAFPAMKRAAASRQAGETPEMMDIEAINNSVRKLGREHEEIGDAIHTIRRLANDYAVPDDACNTFVITYQKLREFEDDLHKHVHLENNILFSKALAS